MTLLTDKNHYKKLNQKNINIKTKYLSDNRILERNTNNIKNDNISNGIIVEKEYYYNNVLIHKETNFDSRIEYTFIESNKKDEDYVCPNCGNKDKLIIFEDGCPFCNTNFNIDYKDKDLGSKYHYDRVLKNNSYKIITGFIDLFFSWSIMLFIIKQTSRTYNEYDKLKILIYGFILAIILYYFFYLIDAYIILNPIRKYKDNQNEKQKEFWNKTHLDKKKFFNSLNSELKKYFYTKENIIDYDIIDYLKFDTFFDKTTYIEVTLEIRSLKLINSKIKKKEETIKLLMKETSNKISKKIDNINIIKCNNCGASLDLTQKNCSYCGTQIPYYQSWELVKINKK